jgi:prohibitin 2
MSTKQIVAAVCGGLFLILAGLSCHTVPPGHRGVKVTWGHVTLDEYPEGITLKWPIISSIYDQTIQQQAEERTTDCFSKDLQTVKMKYTILFKVPEKQVVPLYRDYRGELFPSLIDNRAQEVIKQVSARYNSEELVQLREKAREEILTSLRERVGEVITIVDFNLVNIDLSDQLEHAIEMKMVQQQQALAKNFEVDKEKKQAEITLVQAKAEAESVKIKGEALKNSPHVVDLEIVKKWDGKAPSTVVVGSGEQGAGAAKIILPLK